MSYLGQQIRKTGRVKQIEARAMSLALDVARARVPAGDDSSREEYLQALRLIERLHRLLRRRVEQRTGAFAVQHG